MAVQHFKAIHYPQMPTFWKALAAVDSVSADVVRFMVLTATRPRPRPSPPPRREEGTERVSSAAVRLHASTTTFCGGAGQVQTD